MADSTALDRVVCPLCDWSGERFEPMGRIPRPNARCPRCSSLERHRAIYLYLRDETTVFTASTRLLHFAPEPALRGVLERCKTIDYVTTDLEMRDVSIHMDIHNLLFRDSVFDCVICSHVLEHVEDDYAAMREIRRVLRPDGFALILVPILDTPDGRTREDADTLTPGQRERAYGQADHLRAYGADFPARAREAGFAVSAIGYPKDLGTAAIKLFGLNSREQLFVCGRPRDTEPPTTLDFVREVSPADGMMRPSAPEHYYNVGLEALRIVADALALTGSSPPRRLLDLPSGYGRVLRMLRAAFPEASITACDTDPHAVDFAVRTFNVEGVVAEPRPEALCLPHLYDLIWCGSLLTHLPEREFNSLLARFERHLEPGGLLIFTTHGGRIDELLQAGDIRFQLDSAGVSALREGFRETGFGFEPYAHSPGGRYGVTLSAKWWVLRALDRRPRLRVVSYREAAWDRRQDVIVCRTY